MGVPPNHPFHFRLLHEINQRCLRQGTRQTSIHIAAALRLVVGKKPWAAAAAVGGAAGDQGRFTEPRHQGFDRLWSWRSDMIGWFEIFLNIHGDSCG